MPNQLERLMNRAESSKDKSFLDEWIHNKKSEEASEINNGGIKAQVKFLVEAYGIDQTEKIVKAELARA